MFRFICNYFHQRTCKHEFELVTEVWLCGCRSCHHRIYCCRKCSRVKKVCL